MIIGTVEATLLLILATLFLGACAYLGYRRTGDPLHPAVILSPLFFLGMVLEPAQRLLHPEIVEFFPNYRGVSFAMTVQYIGMAFFFAGMLSTVTSIGLGRNSLSLLDLTLDDRKLRKIRTVAWSLACFASFGYWYGIYLNGGFIRSYSTGKGGGLASMSGYLGEAQNLGVVAVVFYAISLQRSGLRFINVIAALLMMSPTLLQATFGGRRGPMFIAGASLFVSYFIAIGRVPKLKQIVPMLAVLLIGVVFIGSQRENLYFGSERGINLPAFLEALFGAQVQRGDNFVASAGATIAIYEMDDYHWGRRFITTYLVRPIPRELWPTKYDDISNLLYGKPFLEIQNAHYDWIDILGWRPTNGYAVNSIVDQFWEFSWGYVVVLWLFGRGLSFIWYKFRTVGGYWFICYFIVVSLSIYLPTQSFSAFAHRFLYLSLMSYGIWWIIGGPSSQQRHRVIRTSTAIGNRAVY